MAGFGEDLRFEREKRGVSLAVLSAETKVNPRYFEVLERSEFHELPGGVFRRGIMRAYLNALSLDEQEWMPRFEASVVENARARGVSAVSEDEAWVTFASNVKKNRTPTRRRGAIRWVGVAGLLAVVGLAAWALWHFELQRLVTR
jgi:cytoskeleton protein RodZ